MNFFRVSGTVGRLQWNLKSLPIKKGIVVRFSANRTIIDHDFVYSGTFLG
jgi:hypothetical protein